MENKNNHTKIVSLILTIILVAFVVSYYSGRMCAAYDKERADKTEIGR